MDLFFGIGFIVLSLFLSCIIFMCQKHYDDAIFSAGLGMAFIILLVAGIRVIEEYYTPSVTPIDVYRGNTTLEITYRDSIIIDSTVVWKEEVK